MLALQLFECEKRHYNKQSAAGDEFYKSLTQKEREMAKKLDEERGVFEEENSWRDDGTWKPPGVFEVPVPMQSTESLGLNDLHSILTNARPNALYDHLLFVQERLFILSKEALVDMSEKRAQGFYKYDGAAIEIKDLARFRSEASDNMEQLVCVLRTLQSLRDRIGRAAELSHLTDDELLALKLKLTAFDKRSRYASAIEQASFALEGEKSLVSLLREPWWDINDRNDSRQTSISVTSDMEAVADEKPLEATARSSNMRPTFGFIVLIISLLSTTPVAVAYKHGDLAIGTTHDSDFWQAVSNSILQLLGLITFVWLTLKDPRLSQLTWVWIGMLAGFSGICAIISVPVYLVAPTIWSFIISFAGSIGQVFVQLQVVNAI
ncbi:hypothetical protein E8E11_000536 [Didymella keratinophila]|nr:hypothetical protein E8E11_000536 [Didymella keratinophila]